MAIDEALHAGVESYGEDEEEDLSPGDEGDEGDEGSQNNTPPSSSSNTGISTSSGSPDSEGGSGIDFDTSAGDTPSTTRFTSRASQRYHSTEALFAVLCAIATVCVAGVAVIA